MRVLCAMIIANSADQPTYRPSVHFYLKVQTDSALGRPLVLVSWLSNRLYNRIVYEYVPKLSKLKEKLSASE